MNWTSSGTLTMTNGMVQTAGGDGISFTAGTANLNGVTVGGNGGNGITAAAAGATITNCVVAAHPPGFAGIRVNANVTISGGSSDVNDIGINVEAKTAGISGIELAGNATNGLRTTGGTANVTGGPAVFFSGNGAGAFGASGTLNLMNANFQMNMGFAVDGGGATINLDGCFLTDNNGAFGPTFDTSAPTDANLPPQYDNVTSVINPAPN